MKSSSMAIIERFVKPVVPIVLILLLIFAFNQEASPTPLAGVLVFLICGIILWFGWNWVRRNIVAKWIGILLAVYLAFVLSLTAIGIALGIGLLVLLPFLLVLPFLLYDLLFRQPRKGRFARARAERHNLPL
jgi:hypothetical protein